MIIHPLVQVLIYALVLSEILSAKLPGINDKYAYAVYLLAGTLGWSLFAETVGRLTELFVSNGNLMKKVAFPRICLPLISVGVSLATNLLLLLAIFVVFAGLKHVPGFQAWWLILLTLVTLMFATAAGLFLGIVNVFVRDVGQVVPIVLQLLFWLTPIVYAVDALPEGLRRYFSLNPLYPLISSYQNVLLFNQPPKIIPLVFLAIFSALLMLLSLKMFRKASPEMVDVL